MNPYFYLFYKITLFLNKKGNNEWGSIYGISLLVAWNIIFCYVKLFNMTENSEGKFKIVLIIILSIIFITNSILFLNEKRLKKINECYQNESKSSRKLGNFLVILYIVISLGLIIFI